MDLDDIIGKYQLELLPQDWVESVWNCDNDSPVELPPQYEFLIEEIDFCELMEDLGRYIKDWLSSDDLPSSPHSSSTDMSSSFSRSSSGPNRKTWQHFIRANLNYKAILSLLYIFVNKEPKDLKSEKIIKEALTAAKLYFIFLSIHGSHIYKIFNSVIYCQSLEILKVSTMLYHGKRASVKNRRRNNPGTSRDDEGENSDQDSFITVSNRKNQKKKKKSKKTSSQNDPEEIEEDEGHSLSHKVKEVLRKILSQALNELLLCLKVLPLKDECESLLRTVQIIVNLTRLEKRTSIFTKPHVGTTEYVAQKSYDILTILCDSVHGETEDCISLYIRVILLNLLPSLYAPGTNILPEDIREQNVIRDHSIKFIHKLVINFNESAFKGVKAFVQQLCVRIPDKAEIRARCVQSVTDLLQMFPFKLYEYVVSWVLSLCHTFNVKDRVTGLEIVSKLLSFRERKERTRSSSKVNSSFSAERSSCEPKRYYFSSYEFLLAVVLSRCRDNSPTVRAKALSILCSFISSKEEVVDNIFVTPYSHMETIETSGAVISDKSFFNFKTLFTDKDIQGPFETNPLPNGITILKLLEKLVEDDKVFVRKNAIHALANICFLSSKWITEKRLDILVSSCKDLSISIRKMVILNLTELVLHYSINPLLPKCWVQGVVPLITDNDAKSQEKVLEVIENTIFKNIVRYNDMKDPVHYLPWKLLDFICSLNMRSLFRYACKQWASNHGVNHHMVLTLRSHIGTENNLGAWFLLVCLSEFRNIPNPKFVLDYYYEKIHDAEIVDEYCAQLVIEVLHLNRSELSKDDQVEFCNKLKEALETLAVPLALISRCIDICYLYEKKEMDAWADTMIKICENYLNRTVSPGCNPNLLDEILFNRYVFTLGELILIRPTSMNSSIFNLLGKLVDNEFVDFRHEKSDSRWEGNISETSRAVLIAALGKHCLQDQFAAKSFVPTLGNLLCTSDNSSVKINSLVALTDLCVRFTSLVEPILGDMAVCLKDPDFSVRKNALLLLMQLLQEDYIKMRCPFTYYILCMLEDESSVIRNMTAAFFVNTVLKKHPSIMYQNFLLSLFFFNDYPNFAADNNIEMSPKERELFTMPGKDKEENRRSLYRYMLDHMEDDHRFNITYRLCTEILDEVSEGNFKLDDDGTAVLQDALYVLACDEMRLTSMKQANEESEVMEAISIARKSIITEVTSQLPKLMRRNYVENIIPIIIRLKHKLREQKSTLVKDLMICLRELMKDFKDQIDEILAADPEIAKEIALDLKKLIPEEEEEEEEPPPFNPLLKVALVQCERLSGQDLEKACISLRCSSEILFALNNGTAPRINGNSENGPKNNENCEDGSQNNENSEDGSQNTQNSPKNNQNIAKDNQRRSKEKSPIPSTSSSSPSVSGLKSPRPSTSPKSPGNKRKSPRPSISPKNVSNGDETKSPGSEGGWNSSKSSNENSSFGNSQGNSSGDDVMVNGRAKQGPSGQGKKKRRKKH